ncbi:hypothetical protein IT568_10085 [bacterium]|nr:hypothetical protein [bacterium]
MKNTFLIVFFVVLAGFVWFKKETTTAKLPQDLGVTLPIDQNFQILETDESKNLVKAKLELIPKIASENINFRFLEFPQGVRLLSGTKNWQGKIEKGSSQTFDFTFLVTTKKALFLHLRTTLQTTETQFSKGSAIQIDFGEKQSSKPVVEKIEGYEGGNELSVIKKSERKRSKEAENEN